MSRLNILVLSYLLFCGYIFAQKIENVEVNQDGNIIILTYDLISDDITKKYDVSVEVSPNGGQTYSINPKTLTGDIKGNVQPGRKKKISWDVLKDISELRGENIVFKIIALDEQTSANLRGGGIPSWIWIGGGAVVLGGTAAILASKKKSGGTTTAADLPAQPDFPSTPK
jgi:hypothetical protein